MALPSDLIDLLTEFARSQVDYLLVGGQALALHGVLRFTKDADVWLRDTEPNLAKAEDALRRFGAPPEVFKALTDAAGLDVVWMGVPPARIDLMKAVPGGDFASAWDSRETRRVGETEVQLIGRQDLILLKSASGRPQDLLDVDLLRR